MPVPSYIPILDTEIDPESPVTQSLMTRLRDNMLAVVGGATGAPKLGPGLLSIGGGSLDGILDNTWAPTLPGYYDFAGSGPSVLSTGRTWPWFVFLRVLGDMSISASMALAKTPSTYRYDVIGYKDTSGSNSTFVRQQCTSEGSLFGTVGAPGSPTDNTSTASPGGGCNIGDGGGTSGNGFSSASMYRRWARANPLFGGPSGLCLGNVGFSDFFSLGGGALVLMVDGNLDLTGGTLTADGESASNFISGGAGGSILVFCTGTLTGGTFNARGAAGGASGIYNGGGGGYIATIANAYAGSQVYHVTGGGGSGGGSAGGNGVSEKITLASGLISSIVWR